MNLEKVAILAQRLARLLPIRQLAFAAALLGLPAAGVVTAFGLAPGTVADTLERSTVTVDLPLPPFAEASSPEPQRFTSQERVLRGDTVAGLIARLGITDEPAMAFLRTDPVGRKIFRQLIPGRSMQADTEADGRLVSLRYFVSPGNVLEVARGAGCFGRIIKISILPTPQSSSWRPMGSRLIEKRSVCG